MAVSRGQRLLLSAGAAVLAVAAVATWTVLHYHLFDRGRSTPLTVDEARDRYRDSTSTAGASVVAPTSSTTQSVATEPVSVAVSTTLLTPVVAQLPLPGVYTYTTTGSDAVDALTGAHHDYPATTTITVTASGCGVTQRWDVLQERWEEWQRCVTANTVEQPGRINYDQFFGESQTDTYVCSGQGRPIDAAAGTTWISTCEQSGQQDQYTGSVVGTEMLAVGADEVIATHVRVTIVTPTASDVQVIDTWYRQGTDLVVAQTASAATTNPSPLGPVHYTEHYEIHLDSLTPLT